MYDLDNFDIERISRLDLSVKYDYPWFDEVIAEQKSIEEFKIQKWWVSKLDLIDRHVNILNSGIGYYSVPFVFQRGAKSIHTFDLCPTTDELAWKINNSFRTDEYRQGNWPDAYTHHRRNITFEPSSIRKEADVFVNTSCEHSYPMGELLEWQAKGKMCVMSGNNLTKRGHINLINSLDQLKEQCGLSHIINEDVMEFNYEDDMGSRTYQQFSIIGIK